MLSKKDNAMQTVSLSDFQNHCVVLLKQVEKIGESLLITEDGHPVVRIMPYDESSIEKYTEELLAMLRGNVRHYDAPEEPVGESEWKSLQC